MWPLKTLICTWNIVIVLWYIFIVELLQCFFLFNCADTFCMCVKDQSYNPIRQRNMTFHLNKDNREVECIPQEMTKLVSTESHISNMCTDVNWPTWLNRCSRKLWSFFCLSWDSHTLEGISSPAEVWLTTCQHCIKLMRNYHVSPYWIKTHMTANTVCVSVYCHSLKSACYKIQKKKRHLTSHRAVKCVYGCACVSQRHPKRQWERIFDRIQQLCKTLMINPAGMCGQMPVISSITSGFCVLAFQEGIIILLDCNHDLSLVGLFCNIVAEWGYGLWYLTGNFDLFLIITWSQYNHIQYVYNIIIQ